MNVQYKLTRLRANGSGTKPLKPFLYYFAARKMIREIHGPQKTEIIVAVRFRATDEVVQHSRYEGVACPDRTVVLILRV